MNEPLRIHTSDGEFDAYVCRPPRASAAAVLVLHEVLGPNATMRETCEALAREGFLALCPDLSWRLGRVEPSGAAQGDWALARSLQANFDLEQGVNDVTATIWQARGLLAAGGKVGVLGFGLGGLLSFRSASCSSPDAAIAYYGAGMQRHLEEIGSLRSPLLVHLAQDDAAIPPHDQQAIAQAFRERPQVELHVYPDCRHAFANPASRHHDPQAARLAWRRSLGFLRRHLA